MNDKEDKMIKISLPDGSQREYAQCGYRLPSSTGHLQRLADAAVCAEVEGKLVDMDHVIDHDAAMMLHTFESDIGKEVYWHSTAHLMAQAVKQLFPKVQVTIGLRSSKAFTTILTKKLLHRRRPDPDRRADERAEQSGLKYQRRAEQRRSGADFRRYEEDYKLEILAEIPDGDNDQHLSAR